MSGGSGSGPLVPTFHGFVSNSMDGLLLFEACLSGKLHHVPRRPHDRERTNLIKSGSIFIYEENASGIKRWTDGVAWSPSRILGNFLIYRELEKPFPPGEKKRAMKRKRSSQIDGQPSQRTSEDREPIENSNPPTPPTPKAAPEHTGEPATNEADRELDRQLIGSLVDSYGFRPDGLVKKTMSVTINGVSHHLVSYYKVEDVKSRILVRPSEDPRTANLQVRPDLFMKQNFRTPVEDSDQFVVDANNYHSHPATSYSGVMQGGYPMRPNGYMPTPNYPMYGVPTTNSGMYAPATAQGWPSAQQAPMPSGYPGASYGSTQGYNEYYNRPSAGSASQASHVKTEDANGSSTPYSSMASQSASYPSSGARPTSGSYSSMTSQYQSPMRSGSTVYTSSAGAQHASPALSGPVDGHAYGPSSTPGHGAYDNKQHHHRGSASYAPQPATSGYANHNVSHNPTGHDQIKSPAPPPHGGATPHTGVPQPMQYRPQNYQSPGGAPHGEVGNIGMSSGYGTAGPVSSAPYHTGAYAGYSSAGPSYRSHQDGSVPNHGQY